MDSKTIGMTTRGTGNKSELMVITKTKELCSYVMTVTDKSPKRFRFTLVSRMQNTALDALENLFLANEVFAAGANKEKIEERITYQNKALISFKLLGYISQLAMEQNCILQKQYAQITKQIHDCRNLTGAWIRSDKNRLGV